jgi:hypothetical protein
VPGESAANIAFVDVATRELPIIPPVAPVPSVPSVAKDDPPVIGQEDAV